MPDLIDLFDQEDYYLSSYDDQEFETVEYMKKQGAMYRDVLLEIAFDVE